MLYNSTTIAINALNQFDGDVWLKTISIAIIAAVVIGVIIRCLFKEDYNG